MSKEFPWLERDVRDDEFEQFYDWVNHPGFRIFEEILAETKEHHLRITCDFTTATGPRDASAGIVQYISELEQMRAQAKAILKS